MNGQSGEEAIANYAYPPCIACDCFVARLAPPALRLAMTLQVNCYYTTNPGVSPGFVF